MKYSRVSIALFFSILVSVPILAKSDSERPFQSQVQVERDYAFNPTKADFFRTDHRSDGNRITRGEGNLPILSPTDVLLNGTAVWVTGIGFEQGVFWAVVLEDGSTQAFQIVDGKHYELPIFPAMVTPDAPPILVNIDGTFQFLSPKGPISSFSHPVMINSSGHIAYIDRSGNLTIEREFESQTLNINAQLDAKILIDGKGRLLVNTDPSTEYHHGIMGDAVEAKSITLVDVDSKPKIIQKLTMPNGQVFEGISPIWVDLDGDGKREIIATLSNARQGAQLVVFNEYGKLVAQGPPIGAGGRWRHQIAAGPFGPRGEMEIVDVLTPHIGGTVEFFRWEGSRLSLVSQVSGLTSHIIGSRNLDMAVAGHFDTTGKLLLLVPNQARTQLSAIQRVGNDAKVVWSLPISGRLSSNIAAVETESGEIAVAVGRSDGTVRIWQP